MGAKEAPASGIAPVRGIGTPPNSEQICSLKKISSSSKPRPTASKKGRERCRRPLLAEEGCGSSCPSLCEMRNSNLGQKHILGRGFCLAVHDALRLNTGRYLVTPPARPARWARHPAGRWLAMAAGLRSLAAPTAHLKLKLSFILHHARHAGHSFVRTHEPYEGPEDKRGDWKYRRLSYQGRGIDTGSVA